MSRHWIAARQEALEQGQDINEAIEKIAAKNRALANQLKKIDWAEIRADIAKKALDDTAAHFNMQLTKTFEVQNNQYGSPIEKPKGEVLGVLATDVERFGVVNNKGKLSFVSTRFEHGESGLSERQKQWKAYFEERRQIRSLETMAQVVGKNVNCKTDDAGTTVVNFVIDEVLQ